MRPLATMIFGLGVALITHGVTRWMAFQRYVGLDYNEGFGDPRSFTAFQHMLAESVAGIIAICLSAYLFTLAKRNRP